MKPLSAAPAATPSRGHAKPRRGVSVRSRWGWGPSASGKKLDTTESPGEKRRHDITPRGKLANMRRTVFTIAMLVVLCAVGRHLAAVDSPAPAGTNWTQWGGPTRDFMSPSKGLASSWPSAGTRKRWSRALGEGHSSILVEGDRLYTMYRPGGGMMSYVRRSPEEVIAALDAATGKTIWEYKYAAPTEGVDFSQGAGPH